MRVSPRRDAVRTLSAAALLLAGTATIAGSVSVTLQGESVDLSTDAVTQRLAPEVAYNGTDDEYMVVWFDTRNPSNNDVFGQRIGADGVLEGSNFPVIEFAEAQIDPAIAYSPAADRYLASWRTQQSGFFNRGRGRLLEADGSQAGSEFLIGNGHEMSLVYSPASNEWLSTARSPDIRGQRVTSTGALAGGEILLSSGGAPAPNGQAAYDRINQRYLATFRNQVDERLEGRLVSVDGVPIGGVFTISPVFPASGRAAAAAFDFMNGRYLVVFGVFQGTDLLGQLVDIDGNLVGGELTIASGLPGSVDPALVYEPASGGYIVAWFDGQRITAQGLTADGAPDGDAVHFADGTAGGRVRLAASGTTGQALAVWTDYRNAGVGEPDIYAQRLLGLDPAWVPPTVAVVRWIGCAPNPVVDGTSVRFALPSAGDTRLEIVAADGRLVRTLSGGRLEAGEHAVGWDRTDAEGRRVPSGVYFVRMRGESGTLAGPKVVAVR